MRYDSYESKVVKLANFFKLVFKHRIKIIIATAAMMILTVTLLATKGIIVGAEECPEEVVYGNTLEYSPGAFISDTSFEYSRDGENWSSEYPVYPGNYYVRAVADATFGERYGEPQPFRILPKPITVRIADNGKVQYGNLPEVTANLAYSDLISCDSFVYAPAVEGSKTVTADLDGIKISDVNGSDVTFCYKITATASTMSVVPRDIDITVHDAEKIYDGTELIPTEYTVEEGGLVNGDSVTVTLVGSQTDAGVSVGSATYVFYDKNGENVSDLYNVKLTAATLTVNKREITVSSSSATKVYDGKELSEENYTVTAGTLAEGESLAVTDFNSILDAGESENSFTAKIIDENGNVLNNNYSISYDFGTLTVTRRPVTITTGTHAFVFDNEEHVYGTSDITASGIEGNENSGLCEGHSVKATLETSFKNVADTGLNNIQYEIRHGGAVIDKANYEITEVVGTVTIAKRPVKIDTGTHEFVYDGKIHSFGEGDVTASGIEGDENSGLCDGHYVFATQGTQFKNVTDSGDNLIEYEIREGDAAVDTDNYEIIVTVGKVSVTKRPVTIATGTHAFTYDGTEHVYGIDDLTVSGIEGDENSGLAENHYVFVTEETKFKNATDTVTNAIKYEIRSGDEIIDKSNYDITEITGTVKIDKISLVFKSPDITVTYDGKEHDGVDYSTLIKEGELAAGHRFELEEITSYKDVVEDKENYFKIKLFDSLNEDPSENYDVTYDYGTINVAPPKITVDMASGSYVYTGKDISIGYDSVTGLIDGHELVITGITAEKNVGTYVNTIYEYDIVDENGDSVKDNYQGNVINDGELTITKRKVMLITGSAEETYSAEPLTAYEWVCNAGNPDGSYLDLAEGHLVYAVGTYSSITNVGSIDNVFTGEVYVHDENGEDASSNYEIETGTGTLTVKPRPVTIVTVSDEFVYDDEIHTYGTNSNHVSVKAGDPFGLCNGHEIIITSTTSYKYVKDGGENRLTFVIVDEETEKNYDVTTEYGTVTVKPRPVKITTASDEFVYDDEERTYGLDDITAAGIDGDENSGLCASHSIFVKTETKFKEVKDSGKNDIEYEIHRGSENIDLDNYDITEVIGTVTVNPRPVKITTGSHEFVYDDEERTYGLDDITAAGIDGDANSGLCASHAIFVTAETSFKNVKRNGKNVESYDNSIEYVIKKDGTEISKDNYDITEVIGKVTVKPRPVKITTASDEFVYDDEERTYGLDDMTVEGIKGNADSGLCEGHYVFVAEELKFKEVKRSGKDVASYDNDIQFAIRKTVSGTENFETINKDNYEITLVLGKIKVNPRPIKITTKSETFVYDGKNHEYGREDMTVSGIDGNTDSGLCTGHEIVVNTKSGYKNVKWNGDEIVAYDNDIKYVIEKNGTEINKDNYDVTAELGKITINPRPVTITTGTHEFVYDGVEHKYDATDITAEGVEGDADSGLCDGHTIYVVVAKKYKDVLRNQDGTVGSYENNISYQIRQGSTTISKKNYVITDVYGSVTVKPRPMTITTANDEFVYDGVEHKYDENHITTGGIEGDEKSGLASVHTIYVQNGKIFTNVSDSGKNDIVYEIREGNTQINRDNYEITETFGTVTVNPRPIKITTGTHEFVYDGKEYTYDGSDITAEEVDGEEISGLCDGHSLYAITPSVFKNVVLEAENIIEYGFESNGIRIDSNNYTVTEEVIGTVTITKRPITVTSESYTGVYDGEERNLNKITVSETEGMGLCEGHSISAEDKIYKNAVLEIENDVAFDILDADSVSAKENYEITYNKGKITITPLKITVNTESQEWFFDDKDHSAPNFTFDIGSAPMLEGDKLIVESGSAIKEPGSTDNQLSFKVIDSETLEDLTENYEIVQNFGTLTVNPAVEPDDFDEELPEDMPIDGTNISGNEPDDKREVMFVIKSDTTGKIYLKRGSYGDYTGNSWLSAEEYSGLILDYASAYYLASMAAENGGASVSSMLIESKYGIYVLPYYAQDRSGLQISDTIVSGDASYPYTVYYFTDIESAELHEELIAFEEAYREFVYAEYLEIDSETLAYMKGVISQEGFTKNDISAVAKYIQEAAGYDLDYNKALDKESNIVIAFLNEYKSGICQHYASAATMLYRALGIPARYTVGYVGDVTAGIPTEITAENAHAWVEIYLDGIGWVQVEVTGSLDDGEGDTEEPPEKEDEPALAGSKITVYPATQSKEYDSYPLYAKNEIDESDEVLKQLLELGYKYEVKVTGVQKGLGTGVSRIESFIIYDKSGTDVTSYYDVETKEGKLVVSYSQIEIYIYEKIREYSGKTHSHSVNEYKVLKIADGLIFELTEINISLTDAGAISSEEINRETEKFLTYRIISEEDGTDVTEHCSIKVVSFIDGGIYDVIRIDKCKIMVSTGDATKDYDGKALTNPNYSMSGKLADGHQLSVKVIGTQTSVGESDNTVDKSATKITDANGVDKTENYVVSYTLGKLTVTPAE